MDTRGDTNAYTGGEMGEAAIESDGTDVFVIYDGKRIAKRGHPDTVAAKPRTTATSAPRPAPTILPPISSPARSRNRHTRAAGRCGRAA
jgi:hypothetical protein